MTAFRVGQLVVCVDAGPREWYGRTLPCPLVERAVYEVRDVIVLPVGCGLALVGVVHAPAMYGFYADRFRPVQPTSIEWAHELVNDLPKQKQTETV